MVTTEEIRTAFKKAANDLGYETVKVDIAPFRDLKVKWCRSSSWINFDVTDYLESAPIEVIEGLAETICGRIAGEGCDRYPEEVERYLTSDDFVAANQSMFIERSRSIGEPGDEDSKLYESYRRLVDKGLVNEITGLKMFWSKDTSSHKIGQSSCLMRVVILNRVLNGKDVPEDVLDYSLLSQLANIDVSFGLDVFSRRQAVESRIESYPDAASARSWLEAEAMEV